MTVINMLFFTVKVTEVVTELHIRAGRQQGSLRMAGAGVLCV